jgi:hypothetical protein
MSSHLPEEGRKGHSRQRKQHNTKRFPNSKAYYKNYSGVSEISVEENYY